MHTGGRFSSREERPLYFLAATISNVKSAGVIRRFLASVAYAKSKKSHEQIRQMADDGDEILLDSGIHTLGEANVKAKGISRQEALAIPPDECPGWAGMSEAYLSLLRLVGDKVWGYVESDQGGATWKREIRKRYHDAGFSPIPVYHPMVDPYEYFDELCEGFDRVAVGNIAFAETKDRLAIVNDVRQRAKRYPHVWMHGLGYTPDERVIALPWDSMDSSTWIVPLQYPLGMNEKAMGRNVYRLGREFTYDRSVGAADPKGQGAAYRQAGYMARCLERNVAGALGRIQELGFEPWEGRGV